MPATHSYPGVYIEEVPSGVRTITGVATSIAAFVGYTQKGPVNEAVHVTSFADFERSHGGLDLDSPVSYSVRQFFMNGGTEAFVVRVASGYQYAQWQLTNPDDNPVLQIVTTSPGEWGNNLRLRVDHVARNARADFNIEVLHIPGPGLEPQVVETHRNLSMDQRSPDYVVGRLESDSRFIRAARYELVFTKAGAAKSKPLADADFPLEISDAVLAGTVDGHAFQLNLVPAETELATWTEDVATDVQKLVTSVETAIASQGLDDRLEATKEENGAGDCLTVTSLSTGESSSVRISAGAFGGLAAKIGLGLANGGIETRGDAQHRPNEVGLDPEDDPPLAPSNHGKSGNRGGAEELIGVENEKKGIYALLDLDLFNLLSIPETMDLTREHAESVIQAALALCERKRAFYIVDPPRDLSRSEMAEWDVESGPRARNAATYFPALEIADPLAAFRPRKMAPSGTLAGVYARTDSTRGIWKAPAGVDATLNATAGLSESLNDIQNGALNTKGVNALRSFPTYGRVAWGARTMRGADGQADEYKYIPVRRLALFIEESLYRGTQWVVFEPNDEPLWAQIRLNIGAFMQNLFRQGAFQGKSPREAYLVKCDSETTTQNDINTGVVNIIVGFAPLKPAEFVIIKIQQLAGQIEV